MNVDKNTNPIIGILGWEKSSNDTLAQLDLLPGNIAHPDTFDFPVIYKQVKGACYQTIVVDPDNQVLQEMVETARILEKEGIRAIMGNCGFNSLFQKQLARAVKIPVFSSSLLLVPMVARFFGDDRKIGIITADKPHLTSKHLQAVGITPDIPVCIYGIEEMSEFKKIRQDPSAELDINLFEQQILAVAHEMVLNNNTIGAIILECTDLPPFSAAIRKSTGLPVFDIVTLANMVYDAICGNRWTFDNL